MIPGGIGGNPPLPADWLAPAPVEGRVAWLASGRDAYLLAARLLVAVSHRWLVPSFTCPVVPVALRAAGCEVVAYRPGRLVDALEPTAVAVLAWSVDRGPAEADIAASRAAAAVVEDRALWAGLPGHMPPGDARRFALGSARKWLGGAEGGWLVAPADCTGVELAPPAAAHGLLALAAAACRAARADDEAPTRDSANAALAADAEQAVGTPTAPRAMSRIGRLLLDTADADRLRQRRAEVAGRLAAALGLPVPDEGASGVAVERSDRDAFRQRLAVAGIRAPIHWIDGAWTNDAWACERAATTLTLPCPAHLTAAQEAAYLATVREVW